MPTAFHGKVRCLHVPLRSSLSLWLRTLGKWEAQTRKGTYLPKGHSCYVAGKGSLFLCPFHRGQEESEASWVHEFSPTVPTTASEMGREHAWFQLAGPTSQSCGQSSRVHEHEEGAQMTQAPQAAVLSSSHMQQQPFGPEDPSALFWAC